MAVAAGAAAVGLVAEMPSGPGVIDEALIARIAPVVPAPIETFLLTSEVEARAIAAQHGRTRTTTLQLVDRVAPGTHAALRRSLPGVRLVQVVHVTGAESLDEAREVAREVDAVLLDSGNPGLARKELGGTGRTHDWALSRRIRDSIDRPLFLAGGLTPDNVGAAIRQVRPYGVDICSGVRTGGALDADKLAGFMAAVAAADR